MSTTATYTSIQQTFWMSETFGSRLLKAVKEAGGPIEQEPLSKWFLKNHGIKISGAMLNKYKNQDKLPRIEQARAYAKALGVCVEWLYTGDGPKYPTKGPMTQEEQQVLGMYRHMAPTLQEQFRGQMILARLTPTIAEHGPLSEEEMERLYALLSETGKFQKS